MGPSVKHIAFENSQNPRVGFDLIRLEDLQVKTDMGHSQFQLHLVRFYLIILIEAGEGLHTIDFQEYAFRPGSILTIRKDQIHRFHRNTAVRGAMMLFTDEFLISYLEALETKRVFQLFNDVLTDPVVDLPEEEAISIKSLTQRVTEEYFNKKDDISLSIIRSELHILMAKLFRIQETRSDLSSSRKYLSEFIEFQHLIERNATTTRKVKDYAMMMGCSTKTLNTISQSIIHKSAKAFVDDICTKQIKRLLINTEETVKEIAFATGFEETTNFYKYFRRQTGMTPEQFRANGE